MHAFIKGMPCAGDDDDADADQIKGQGNHPASRQNLQSRKQCQKCMQWHGNKKGAGQKSSRCGKAVPVTNGDGTPKLDAEGKQIVTICDYVFVSSTQRGLRDAQRKALLADQPRLPDVKRMRYAHVEKAFASAVKKVLAEQLPPAFYLCLQCEMMCCYCVHRGHYSGLA